MHNAQIVNWNGYRDNATKKIQLLVLTQDNLVSRFTSKDDLTSCYHRLAGDDIYAHARVTENRY